MVLDTDFEITMPNIFKEFKAKIESSHINWKLLFKKIKYTKKYNE